MKDLINREALLERMDEKLNVMRRCGDVKEAWGLKYAMAMVQNAPAVDAVEVVHGRNASDTPSRFECSVCHWSDWDTYTADTPDYNYCPHCGSRMDGE